MRKPQKVLKLFETKNICKKVYFGTKEDADGHIEKRSKEEKAKPAHSYLCFKCNCWHITSWTAPDIEKFINDFNLEVEQINKDIESDYERDTKILSSIINELVELKKEKKKLELEIYKRKKV